ncbi:MAG: hypothetical protein ACOC6C_06535 [Verrucomicrobiota bacterium]
MMGNMITGSSGLRDNPLYLKKYGRLSFNLMPRWYTVENRQIGEYNEKYGADGAEGD